MSADYDAGLTPAGQDRIVKELFTEDDSCIHNLMGMFDVIDDIAAQACNEERERVLREFEGLADYWTLSKGWIGPVALHDFRRKIDHLRGILPPEGGDA